MFLSRKLGAQLVKGNPGGLAQAATPYVAHIRDQLDKYKLRIGESQCASGVLKIAPGESEELDLPDGYAPPANLSVILSTEDLISVTLTHGLHADDFVVLGDEYNEGLFSCCQPVDGILITNGTNDEISVNYTLFQLPDLSKPESWALGYLATGVVPS